MLERSWVLGSPYNLCVRLVTWCTQRADMFSITVVTTDDHHILNDHHISTWLPQGLQRSWKQTAGNHTCWRHKSSQLWHCVFGWRPPNVSIQCSFYCQNGLLDLKDKGTKTLQNVRNTHPTQHHIQKNCVFGNTKVITSNLATNYTFASCVSWYSSSWISSAHEHVFVLTADKEVSLNAEW